MVFLEPELLTAAPEFCKTSSAELPTMQGDVATLQRDLISRYWAARAKRERGGVEPSRDDVRRLKAHLGAG